MTEWISLSDASDMFNSPREFFEFVKEYAVGVRGRFYIDYTIDSDYADRTLIPRRFLQNSVFKVEANQIYANDSFSVPEGQTNYEMYGSVQVNKVELDRALMSHRRPKRGPRYQYDRAILDELFEDEYDPAIYSQRQFAEYVRKVYREAGGRVPDERTIRRALEAKMRAALKPSGA